MAHTEFTYNDLRLQALTVITELVKCNNHTTALLMVRSIPRIPTSI